mmetsp:Transcript_10338/g.19851  ORF Transcript_10338/g.19851 Transcript_10338/m.19851 type:complete len:84 (-) Transcript_10338:45-296(-)
MKKELRAAASPSTARNDISPLPATTPRAPGTSPTTMASAPTLSDTTTTASPTTAVEATPPLSGQAETAAPQGMLSSLLYKIGL